MAATTTPTALNKQVWSAKYLSEYVRSLQFADLMGTGINKPIYVVKDLTKSKGDQVTVPFVLNLSNSGITGDNTLAGNEEALATYGHKITVDQYRNAVLIGSHEDLKSAIDMPKAAREKLKGWSADLLRDHILAAAGSANVDGKTAYASCSEAQKDAWSVANSDRVLFGNVVGNYSGDHSADLLKVDATNDTLIAGSVQLMKRVAKLASPKIKPVRVDKGGEWYVLLAQSYAFRDLAASLSTVHQNAAPRSLKDNPLFRDGDLVYNGVIVKEVEEIAVISGVGAAGIDVAPCYLLGQGALGVAWAKMPAAKRRKEDDYENLMGVGIAETHGAEKLMSNEVQFGMVTTYFAGVADL